MEALAYLVVLAVVIFLVYLVKAMMPPPKDPNLCPDCEGKGYYEAVRGREPCRSCRGSGKIA